MAIGERLRRRREARGWSPRQLALESDVSHQTIRNIEAGLDHRTSSLAKLARALDCTVGDLIEAVSAEEAEA